MPGTQWALREAGLFDRMVQNEAHMVASASRHMFTVDEYERMAEVGIFNEDSPVELIEGVVREMRPVAGARYMFTVDDFELMGRVGIFNEDSRVELIEGEIREMSPINSPHAGCVNDLIRLLTPQITNKVLLTVQNPIRLNPYSQPQPDLALLRLREDSYRLGHPGPGDILLLIEVADTTIQDDRNEKVPTYAKAGIAEVWLVDLNGDAIEVYSRPQGGEYRQFERLGRGEHIFARLVPGLELEVDAILGPQPAGK